MLTENGRLILFWVIITFKCGFFNLGLNNEEYQVVLGNDTTHYIIDDLEPASNYTFYIVAYMPMGASQMSDHVIQNTLEDGEGAWLTKSFIYLIRI
jgi:hypothetical protein